MVQLIRRQYPPLYPEPLGQLQSLLHQQQTAIEEGELWEVVHDPNASSSTSLLQVKSFLATMVEAGRKREDPGKGSEKMAADKSHLTKPL